MTSSTVHLPCLYRKYRLLVLYSFCRNSMVLIHGIHLLFKCITTLNEFHRILYDIFSVFHVSSFYDNSARKPTGFSRGSMSIPKILSKVYQHLIHGLYVNMLFYCRLFHSLIHNSLFFFKHRDNLVIFKLMISHF